MTIARQTECWAADNLLLMSSWIDTLLLFHSLRSITKKTRSQTSPMNIDNLVAVNILYMATLTKKKPEGKPVTYAAGYLGGGVGGLSVPRTGEPDVMERGVLFDIVY